jgi:hypothetical protein
MENTVPVKSLELIQGVFFIWTTFYIVEYSEYMKTKLKKQEEHLMLVQSELSVYQVVLLTARPPVKTCSCLWGPLLNQQAKTSGCITALILLNK